MCEKEMTDKPAAAKQVSKLPVQATKLQKQKSTETCAVKSF